MDNKIVDKAFLDDVLKNPWKTTPIDVKTMAETILAERAEREKNPDVWDGAPDDAVAAYVRHGFMLQGMEVRTGETCYTRELPKTRAREIAEEIVKTVLDFTHDSRNRIETLEDVERKLLEYAEGLK